MKGKKAASKIPQPGDPNGKFDSNKGPSKVYAGGDSNVVKAARARKKGGKVEGDKAAHRLDRPKRKEGGKVLSAAASTSTRPGADIQSKGGQD